MRYALLPLILCIMLPSTIAALVTGTVYDISLTPVDGVVIEINSVPQQRIISTDGTYHVLLNPGNYTLTAMKEEDKISENISIVNDGDYQLDLFLFPGFSEEDELINDTDVPLVGSIENFPIFPKKNFSLHDILLMFVLLIITFIVIVLVTRKTKKEDATPKESFLDGPDDEEHLLSILRQEGGRITQKDLRKHFALSEAKISLMVSSLENKGKVQKIKKGRGNIIILK